MRIFDDKKYKIWSLRTSLSCLRCYPIAPDFHDLNQKRKKCRLMRSTLGRIHRGSWRGGPRKSERSRAAPAIAAFRPLVFYLQACSFTIKQRLTLAKKLIISFLSHSFYYIFCCHCRHVSNHASVDPLRIIRTSYF